MAAADDRTGLGGGAAPDRGRRGRQRLARCRSSCARAVHRFEREPRRRDRLEHRHRAGPGAGGRRAQQRLPGRARLGRGALRGGRPPGGGSRSPTPTTATGAASAGPTRPAPRAGASCSRRAIYDEVGPFDERFNPAYCEDTDYWHRAWELGIELTPVPAARVTHPRRTSAERARRLAAHGHRYMYGWKHGVDPMRPAAVLQPRDRRVRRRGFVRPGGDGGARS